MNCPKCGSDQLYVLESRSCEGGVRRRRGCVSCEKRFTTYEYPAGTEKQALKGLRKILEQALKALDNIKI